MSLSYEIREDVRRIHVIGSGDGNREDVLRVIESVAAAIGDAEHVDVLADMREYRYGPPLEEARELATRMRSFPEYQRMRIAVLCPDLLQVGLARFVAAIAGQSGIAIESFRDAGAAEGWLASLS